MKANIVDLLAYELNLNFIVFIALVAITLLLRRNNTIEKKSVFYIRIILIILTILGLADGIDHYLANLDVDASYPIIIRRIASFMGYIIRPSITVLTALIVIPNEKRKWYIFIPFVINTLIFMTVFFPWGVCYIDSRNRWTDASAISFLRYFQYFVHAFYLLLMLIFANKKYRDRKIEEIMVLVVIDVLTIGAGVIEAIFENYGLVNNSIAISIVFYCLFLSVKSLQRDALTGFLNRASYYDDLKYNDKDITALISIDMNNLKLLNDTYGHKEGDKALVSISDAIRKALPPKALCYRIGGDEFTIICVDTNKIQMVKIIEKIQENMKSNKYSIAIGYAYRDMETIDELITKADAAMYLIKREMKENM